MDKIEIIEYLIEELKNEDNNFNNITVGESYDEKWQLFRSLVNIRKPKEISEKFLILQDKLLKEEIKNKSITDSLDFVYNDKMCIWRGDITTLKVDAIVNAANSYLLGCFYPCHGCIDNAIHTYSGIQLRLECDKIMKNQITLEETGKAKITKAYNLPSKYIIHTVGPVVGKEVTKKNIDDLKNCYNSCLTLAEQNNISYIAFCAISCGEYRFPIENAAKIAVSTVKEYLKTSLIKGVIFNVFKEYDYEIYERTIRECS